MSIKASHCYTAEAAGGYDGRTLSTLHNLRNILVLSQSEGKQLRFIMGGMDAVKKNTHTQLELETGLSKRVGIILHICLLSVNPMMR